MTPRRILFFYPSNERSLQIETTILALHRRGQEIELLTTCERGPLHGFLESEGVPVHAHPVAQRNPVFYYARQIGFLARFVRSANFSVVFSNLQHANLIAVLAQRFMSARVVAFRHHFKFVFKGDDLPLTVNAGERIFDRVINRLARKIVVPSSAVYAGMRATEKVYMRRVVMLPYIYDFDRFPTPRPHAVAQLRAEYPARLTLLMSARLIPFKRPGLVLEVVRDLLREGLDVRLLVLGEGPEEDELRRFIISEGIADRVAMLGWNPDPIDYMAASDLLVHPSLTEASSNVVKEMALLGKTAIVCRGVGDFDDYIEHGRSGFLVPRTTDGSEIADLIRAIYRSPAQLPKLAGQLRTDVLGRFSLTEERVARYVSLAES